MKRAGLGVLLAALWTATATAQTPLCAWNGASLSCPDRPAPVGPLTPQAHLGAPPTPAQRLEQLQTQADFDRALIAAQVAQDAKRTETLARAEALIAAGECSAAETLVREKAPTELARLASRCAAARK